MFSLGFTEILLILTVALLVLGPSQLPTLAKTIGKTMGELRRTLDDLKKDISFQPVDIKQELFSDSDLSELDKNNLEEPQTPEDTDSSDEQLSPANKSAFNKIENPVEPPTDENR